MTRGQAIMQQAKVRNLEKARDDARRAAHDRAVVLDEILKNDRRALQMLFDAYKSAPDGMLPAEVYNARMLLEKSIDAAVVIRAKYPLPVKTLKLSGVMIDATDRDLAGNPTLEGDCRL